MHRNIWTLEPVVGLTDRLSRRAYTAVYGNLVVDHATERKLRNIESCFNAASLVLAIFHSDRESFQSSTIESQMWAGWSGARCASDGTERNSE